MSLFHVSPIMAVKLKHVRFKRGSSAIYFQRRVPDDIKQLAPAGSKYAGKAQYIVSLQTTDPKVR